MKVAVDFDGVIRDTKGIPTESSWTDEPTEGAKDAINYLVEIGHEVYVCTANANLDAVNEWLTKWKFPDLEVTNKKKTGTKVYIDDRAVRFTNWNDIRKYFG